MFVVHRDMKIFNGKKVAQKILEKLAAKIKKERIHPVLAVISVGKNEPSKLYLKLKKEAASRISIRVQEYCFSAQVKEKEIIQKIKELNENNEVDGIIIQLPLPIIFNRERIIGAISPTKDVDGFHQENWRLLQKNKPYFFPVLPSVILLVLSQAFKSDWKNKKIMALVNSEIFGQVLKLVLKKEGAEINYLVRNNCSMSDLEKKLKSADILITVCGCPNLIKKEMIKKGAILIDAGITRDKDGQVVGDVDKKEIEEKASFLTPVPGGIGPLTVALLLRNVYLAARNFAAKKS